MHLIGLDVGTTGCKAVVFTPEGGINGYGFREYPIISDEPKKAEQDAELVWRLTVEVLKEAVTKAVAGGVAADDIGALSVSVQGDAIIPVSAAGLPIHNAVLGMDYRSEPQAARLAELHGDRELFTRTGMRSHPINSLAKILWLREKRTEIFRKAERITTYADYILGRLGAPGVIDVTMASRTMAFDLSKNRWAEDILESAGVDGSLLSNVKPSGTVAGTMNEALADDVGLSGDVTLVAGGHDQTCAAVGAGMIEPGIGLVSTGTAEVFATAFSEPALSGEMFESYYPCYRHAVDGMYFTFSLNHVGGLLLAWFRDAFVPPEVQQAESEGKNFYAVMDGLVPSGPVDVFVLPHFNGSGTPWCDMESRGAFVGLTLATTRHEVYRAMLESQAYELGINLDTMARAGIGVSEIRAVGGGAFSKLWLQIKADALGREVRTLETPEAACLGAALIAGTACGVYKNLEEAVATAVKTSATYSPRTEKREAYAERYQAYRDLYHELKPVYGRIGRYDA